LNLFSNILIFFSHKNIVRLYGYFYDNNYVYLIYEFVKMGSLFQYIKNKTKIDEKEAAYVSKIKIFFNTIIKLF
jgi:serine/threonine protein kinase